MTDSNGVNCELVGTTQRNMERRRQKRKLELVDNFP